MQGIIKPSNLPGFMELSPQDQIQFNNLKDKIRKNYEKFGFLPLDTPVLEKKEVIMAKGGGETEKQIYEFSKGSTEMAMRFDLTVPLAKYVAMNYSNLNFPFRRYQIGKVYRGEKAQRGRYREFYQCDVDIIGNEKLDIVNDAEIPAVIYSTFKDLNFGKFTIRINNRKILNGFFESLQIKDTQSVLRTVDKLEKIGIESVKNELKEIGINENSIESVLQFISLQGKNSEKIENLKALNIENEKFKEGIFEIEKVFEYLKLFGVPEDYTEFDTTIARGLDYYTGTVYETKLDDYPSLGSVCSGGRYDNLAENYTTQKLPGVGISIGLTRLFFQLKDQNILKDEKNYMSDILIIPFEGFMNDALKLVTKLRESKINAFVYTEDAKLRKKMKYADGLNVPYTILLGEDEAKNQRYTFKNMETGEQQEGTAEDIINFFKK